MNLSESVKYVLKHNGQSLLSGFWKEDVRSFFVDFKEDLSKFIKQSSKRPSLAQIKDGGLEVFSIMSELPRRIRTGFHNFRDEFIMELDQLQDPKEKTIFCLKVIGALSRFAVSTAYELKKVRPVSRTALGQFLTVELVLKLSQLFIVRLIGEVEGQVSDPEDLSKLRFFRQMLYGAREGERPAEWEDDPGDRAFQLVDSFKNYIMTGKES